jgi:hypothetical protein
VAEITVKKLLCCGFQRIGSSVSMLVEYMSRNICFPQVGLLCLLFAWFTVYPEDKVFLRNVRKSLGNT